MTAVDHVTNRCRSERFVMKGRPLPSGRVGGFHGARSKMIVAHRTAQLDQLKLGHGSISRSSPQLGTHLGYAFGDEAESCVHCLTNPQTIRAAEFPALYVGKTPRVA